MKVRGERLTGLEHRLEPRLKSAKGWLMGSKRSAKVPAWCKEGTVLSSKAFSSSSQSLSKPGSHHSSLQWSHRQTHTPFPSYPKSLAISTPQLPTHRKRRSCLFLNKVSHHLSSILLHPQSKTSLTYLKNYLLPHTLQALRTARY